LFSDPEQLSAGNWFSRAVRLACTLDVIGTSRMKKATMEIESKSRKNDEDRAAMNHTRG